MKNNRLAFASPFILLAVTSLCDAATYQIKLVTDNDFAVYAGNSTSITRELYQNDAEWTGQISAASSFTFSLLAGETDFYILAMGGGGPEENLSGTVNGVNIVKVFIDTPALVDVSVPVQALLRSNNSNPPDYNLTTVATGAYTPTLMSAQTAIASTSWIVPTVNTSQTVITQNPEAEVSFAAGDRKGFSFESQKAVFYRFKSEGLNIPEPSSVTLLGLGMVGLLWRKRR